MALLYFSYKVLEAIRSFKSNDDNNILFVFITLNIINLIGLIFEIIATILAIQFRKYLIKLENRCIYHSYSC